MEHSRCQANGYMMAAMSSYRNTDWLTYILLDDAIEIVRVHSTHQSRYLGMDGPSLPGFALHPRDEDGVIESVGIWIPGSKELPVFTVTNPKRISEYE